MKRWTMVGALAAAGVVLLGCSGGSTADMTDVVTDDAAAVALIEKGLAGDEDVKCVVRDEDAEVSFHIGSGRHIKSSMKEKGTELSVLFVGDEMPMWVRGEPMGVTASGEVVDAERAAIVQDLKTDLRSTGLVDDGEEFVCGVYTGGSGVFMAPSSVDFVTPSSEGDLIEYTAG